MADPKELKSQSDHDLLIEVCILLKELQIQFGNHLKHHWGVTIVALAAGLAGIFNLTVGILLIILKSQ